jgi:hypothetical protein
MVVAVLPSFHQRNQICSVRTANACRCVPASCGFVTWYAVAGWIRVVALGYVVKSTEKYAVPLK